MQILTRDPVPHLALRARPDDIDHLHIGQPAMLRFPALAAHDLPELVGTVTAISAATFADERSGARYFRVEVALTDSARAALGARTLVPGMAVQAFIATGQRTPLGYLLGPIGDHMRRALREP